MLPSHAFKAFIQARMSSARFPGKVLAPFRGKTVLGWVVERAAQALDRDQVVVATSVEPSDDPVAAHARELGVAVFRGSLGDCFSRLKGCLREHPAEWFYRVCADSPLLDPAVLKALRSLAVPGVDLATNVFPRSFPRGQSGELIRAGAFLSVDEAALSSRQREHATAVFYDEPSKWRIVNLDSGRPEWAKTALTVDSPEDLARLEAAYPADRPLPSWAPAARSAA